MAWEAKNEEWLHSWHSEGAKLVSGSDRGSTAVRWLGGEDSSYSLESISWGQSCDKYLLSICDRRSTVLGVCVYVHMYAHVCRSRGGNTQLTDDQIRNYQVLINSMIKRWFL